MSNLMKHKTNYGKSYITVANQLRIPNNKMMRHWPLMIDISLSKLENSLQNEMSNCPISFEDSPIVIFNSKFLLIEFYLADIPIPFFSYNF